MRIVVGVDGSVGARRALGWACVEAAAAGARVTALLAYGFYGRPFEVQLRTTGSDSDELEAAARAVLKQAVADLASRSGVDLSPVSIEEAVSDDEPVNALLDAVGPDDLLVVGARGLGPVRRLLLGSVSLHCTRHAAQPIVVVRQDRTNRGPADPVGPVVVGMDGSPGSVLALRWAAAHAARRRLPLVVVHVWPISEAQPSRVDELMHVAAQRDRDREEIGHLVERTVEPAQRGTVTVSFVDGSPAPSLIEAAEDASLLVVGLRGKGTFGRLLLGSCSEACLQHAPCHVAIVPQPGPQPVPEPN